MQSLSSLLFVADRGCRSGALVGLTYFVTVLSRRRRMDRQRLDPRWVGAGTHTHTASFWFRCISFSFFFLVVLVGAAPEFAFPKSPQFYYGGEQVNHNLTRWGSKVEARSAETLDSVRTLNCIKQRRPTSPRGPQAHKPP